jgi:hypothetical protein
MDDGEGHPVVRREEIDDGLRFNGKQQLEGVRREGGVDRWRWEG